MKLEGAPILTSDQMACLEARCLNQGHSQRDWMRAAGEGVARLVEHFVACHSMERRVTLVIGKGNNGGDAYVAGTCLHMAGFHVEALEVFSPSVCSPLNQEMRKRFLEAGGTVCAEGTLKGVIVDGLLGTGYRGSLDPKLIEVIKQINGSGRPVLSIDLPSGLDGTTGEVSSTAVRATQTFYLGAPKRGFFLKEGWDHVGVLHAVDFGLPHEALAQERAGAYLLDANQIASHLPVIKPSRHKYEAGYLLVAAGSVAMPGAAALTGYAALRAGAGIVRVFHPSGMELTSMPCELICQTWEGCPPFLEEAKRAQAWVLGPGMGRDEDVQQQMHSLLDQMKLPCVLDADALFALAEHPQWRPPRGSILTPHQGEMKRLLGAKASSSCLEEQVALYAQQHHVVVVLKGAVTWIFSPQEPPLVNITADPGMATAGSGDVLTGIIGALLSQGLTARAAAAVGVYLHGRSGQLAAMDLSSYSVTASDLIDHLPDVFLELKGMA